MKDDAPDYRGDLNVEANLWLAKNLPSPDSVSLHFAANDTTPWFTRFRCGCTKVSLGQGIALLPCKDHEAKVLEAIG